MPTIPNEAVARKRVVDHSLPPYRCAASHGGELGEELPAAERVAEQDVVAEQGDRHGEKWDRHGQQPASNGQDGEQEVRRARQRHRLDQRGGQQRSRGSEDSATLAEQHAQKEEEGQVDVRARPHGQYRP